MTRDSANLDLNPQHSERKPQTAAGPAFPLHVFPKDFQEYVEAVAASTQTPVDAVAFCVLGMLSAVYGTRLDVERYEGWREPAVLYACLVMESGGGKSPIFKHVASPLERLEAGWAAEKEEEVLRAKTRLQQLEQRKEHLLRQSKKGEISGELHDELVEVTRELESLAQVARPRLVTSDVTPERLLQLLSQNEGRLAIVSAETPLFGVMGGRYSSGKPNIEVFLSAHTGEPYRLDRVGRDGERVLNPRLAIVVGTQPGVLQDIRKQPELVDRGLVGRFVFCTAGSQLGSRKARRMPVPRNVREAYEEELLRLGLEALRRDHSQVVRLSEEAGARFDEWWDSIEARRAPGKDLRPLISFRSKVEGLLLRVAGLLHVLIASGDSVGVQTLEDAIEVVDYLIEQYRAAHDFVGGDPLRVMGDKILDWAERRDTTKFTLRECQNSGPCQRESADTHRAALKLLDAEGRVVLRRERLSARGRETLRVEVVRPEVGQQEEELSCDG